MFITLVLATLGLLEHSQDVAKNQTVTTRLVILHPEHAKRHVDDFKRSRWYTQIKDDGYFNPTADTIIEIDRGLGEYLKLVATDNPDAKKFKHFSDGINNIRKIRHVYGGQFMGAINLEGEQIVICMYSLVDDIDAFHKMTNVPYVDDGDGANFHFYYNLKTKEKTGFHISGSFVGPFGSDD